MVLLLICVCFLSNNVKGNFNNLKIENSFNRKIICERYIESTVKEVTQNSEIESLKKKCEFS